MTGAGNSGKLCGLQWLAMGMTVVSAACTGTLPGRVGKGGDNGEEHTEYGPHVVHKQCANSPAFNISLGGKGSLHLLLVSTCSHP